MFEEGEILFKAGARIGDDPKVYIIARGTVQIAIPEVMPEEDDAGEHTLLRRGGALSTQNAPPRKWNSTNTENGGENEEFVENEEEEDISNGTNKPPSLKKTGTNFGASTLFTMLDLSSLTIVDRRGAGQTVGEMAYVFPQYGRRSASVVASSPLICFSLRVSDIEELFTHCPLLPETLKKKATHRLAENTLAKKEPFCNWERPQIRSWIRNWTSICPDPDEGKMLEMGLERGQEIRFAKPVLLIRGECELIDLDTHGNPFVPLKSFKRRTQRAKDLFLGK